MKKIIAYVSCILILFGNSGVSYYLLANDCLDIFTSLRCGPVGSICIFSNEPGEKEFRACWQDASFSENSCTKKVVENYCPFVKVEQLQYPSGRILLGTSPGIRTITVTRYNYPIGAVTVVCESWPATTWNETYNVTLAGLARCDNGWSFYEAIGFAN
jgi:hypothetical protein